MSELFLVLTIIAAISRVVSDQHYECLVTGKNSPSPESGINGTACNNYSVLSCCFASTAHRIDEVPTNELSSGQSEYMYEKLPMDCERYSKAEQCFFHCDPYLGPWKGDGGDRLREVPICASYCDDWFNACKNISLCLSVIVKNETVWHANTRCGTFAALYGNSKGLCDTVRRNDFLYDEDNRNCMVMMFEGENPNANVTRVTPSTTESPYQCPARPTEKNSPSPEPDITIGTACDEYSALSCCNASTAHGIEGETSHELFRDQLSDCGELPVDCQRYLKAESCFYHCDPYLGPWKGEGKDNLRGVPICASYCDDWFNACKNVPLCAANWITDFVKNETTGRRHCANKTCGTFATLYANSKGLCETMWGNNFLYDEDNGNCMVMMFEGENPNANVTPKSAASAFPPMPVLVLVAVVALCLF